MDLYLDLDLVLDLICWSQAKNRECSRGYSCLGVKRALPRCMLRAHVCVRAMCVCVCARVQCVCVCACVQLCVWGVGWWGAATVVAAATSQQPRLLY